MNCPVCTKKMTAADFGAAHVDVCPGCKGLWFDWAELTKLDEHHEGAGKALQEALHHPRINDADRPRLDCPKCRLPMFAHKYDAIEEVNVDECYNCRGFFVDSGELKDIRENLVSRLEEGRYIEKLISENPGLRKGDTDLGTRRQEVQELRRNALRKWGHALKYGLTGRLDS